MPSLKVPAKLENLQIVNDFIAIHVPEQYHGLRSKVELAAEELLVNVFMHAYNGEEGDAAIGCRHIFLDNEEFFCFWVSDNGKPFNPFMEAPSPDLTSDAENRPIGGLGIYLIKNLVRHFAYSYTEQKNIIELYFSLNDEEQD